MNHGGECASEVCEEEERAEHNVRRSDADKSQHESLEDRRMRQAVERERLLRQLEEEEDISGGIKMKTKTEHRKRSPKKLFTFPLPLPDTDNCCDISPLEALENFERVVLGSTMSGEEIRSMQAAPMGDIK